jgi:APA family basic amino acid/polyamine antiporter
MSALVVFSTSGGLAGIVLAGPRVHYAMARDGLLFQWAGAVHPRYGTPHRAVLLQGLWASVLVATGTYRRRPGVKRDYSVWGHPWIPGFFAMSAFAIVAYQVAAEPAQSLTGLGLVLAGLPIYHFWARHSYQRQTT